MKAAIQAARGDLRKCVGGEAWDVPNPKNSRTAVVLNHFTEPRVRPLTTNRCPKNISRIAGIVEMIDAAAISLCWTSYCWAKRAMATGTVAVSREVRLSAMANSFQLKIK